MPDPGTADIKGPEVSRELYGGVLDYDGAGYYPGLELLNLVFTNSSDELLPNSDPQQFVRQMHDFARMLVWDESFSRHPKRSEVLYDHETEEAVRRLLECLQLPIASTTKRPRWERAHFFPYTSSLIHWDARTRQVRDVVHLRLERLYLRGGGALAYRVLRMDPDISRLQRNRKGFEDLYLGQENSALEQLATVLLKQSKSDTEAKDDQIESSSKVFDDSMDDLYRDGTANILAHTELPAVARLRSLFNWTAFWLLSLQYERSRQSLDRPKPIIVCDCGAEYSQLRRASQRCLQDAQNLVVEAMISKARLLGGQLSKQQQTKARGFFWASAATIGLLNAWRGRRHFTLGLDILETLVLAGTDGSSELTLDAFLHNWLYHRNRIVVGRRAAEDAGLLHSFDASIFEDNESSLSNQMSAAGLLTEYSDATKMVGTGGLQ